MQLMIEYLKLDQYTLDNLQMAVLRHFGEFFDSSLFYSPDNNCIAARKHGGQSTRKTVVGESSSQLVSLFLNYRYDHTCSLFVCV